MSVIHCNTDVNCGLPLFKASTPQKGVLTKPIENVSTVIETGVDKIVGPNEDKKNKKSRKRTIAAASTIIVVSALTMFLNPKNSGGLTAKLKNWQNVLDVKIKQSKNNFFTSKVYSFYKKLAEKVEKGTNIYFNLNSGKDVIFDSMCTNKNKKYPEFLTKNKTVHKVVKFFDDGFVKLFKNAHIKTTELFDKISRNTVKSKYKKALKEMDALETMLKLQREKLPKKKQILIDSKLIEIAKAKEAFSEANILKRLDNQEKLMSGIKEDIWNKIYNKKDGLMKNSTGFWAQDLLKDKKNVVEKEGSSFVEKLFGAKNKKGLYDETLDLCKEHLDNDAIKSLEKSLAKVNKTTRKANISECSEYFDKKRDLVLGGAPTDILTQIFGLGLCGWAVTRADKEKRWSKMFTEGVPVVVGLGSALVFSAKLFSGGVGLLAGAVVGAATDIACNIINRYVFKNKDDDEEEETKELVVKEESKNNIKKEAKHV